MLHATRSYFTHRFCWNQCYFSIRSVWIRCYATTDQQYIIWKTRTHNDTFISAFSQRERGSYFQIVQFLCAWWKIWFKRSHSPRLLWFWLPLTVRCHLQNGDTRLRLDALIQKKKNVFSSCSHIDNFTVDCSLSFRPGCTTILCHQSTAKKKKQTKMCWKIHFSRSFSNMDATRSGWPQSHSGIERKKHFFFVHIINVIWTWYNRHTSATVECASCGQKFSVLTNKHKNHLIKQPNCESHNLYGAYTSFIFKIILDIRYICFVLSFGESIAFLPNSYALNFIYSSKIHPK